MRPGHRSDDPTISVIVSTYNGTSQLRLCLESLARNLSMEFEVVVADDGSGPETAAIVNDARDRLGLKLLHAWHEDDGFRLARARNNAARRAKGRFLLFVDHDILVPSVFLDAVRDCMLPGWFVGGRRVMLDRRTTELIRSGQLSADSVFRSAFVFYALRKRLQGRRFLLPLRPRHPGRKPQNWRGMAAFCLGVWREDFLAIDGFDGRYTGHGVEDWDLMARLENFGVRAGYLPRRATVAHLWHPESPHNPRGDAYRTLEEVITSGTKRSRDGISKLPKS